MFYKRKEIFRYTFGKPLEAELKVVDDDYSCTMIDISPGGAKVYASVHLDRGTNVEMNFVLLDNIISARGRVVWKEASREGALYGIDFIEDNDLEEKIISELKFRRRAEIPTK